MKNFFRDRDALGAIPQMTYKSSQTYGTALGGFCSCIVTICTLVYVTIIMSAFLFASRNYNTTTD